MVTLGRFGHVRSRRRPYGARREHPVKGLGDPSMEYSMRATLRLAALGLCLAGLGADYAFAQNAPPPQQPYNPPPQQQYSPPPQQQYAPPPQPAGPPPQQHSRNTFAPDEIVREGHK